MKEQMLIKALANGNEMPVVVVDEQAYVSVAGETQEREEINQGVY